MNVVLSVWVKMFVSTFEHAGVDNSIGVRVFQEQIFLDTFCDDSGSKGQMTMSVDSNLVTIDRSRYPALVYRGCWDEGDLGRTPTNLNYTSKFVLFVPAEGHTLIITTICERLKN